MKKSILYVALVGALGLGLGGLQTSLADDESNNGHLVASHQLNQYDEEGNKLAASNDLDDDNDNELDSQDNDDDNDGIPDDKDPDDDLPFDPPDFEDL